MSQLSDKQDRIRELIGPDRCMVQVEDDIYSVLADTSKHHHYDATAKFYDPLMSSKFYHSVMWGSSPSAYISFGRKAVESVPDGIMLDAGCGSMLFTASNYVQTERRIIGIDQSIGMLRNARARLKGLMGEVPEHITLLQADLDDLPFLPGTFSTVLCLNVLHLYEHVGNSMQQFRSLLRPEGKLRLTSLVCNERFIGDRYIGVLYRIGEFVRPRTAGELSQIVEQVFDSKVDCTTNGNMAFISVEKKGK